MKIDKNESPENLLPFCSTHHKYMHCKLKELILEKVESYLSEWKTISMSMVWRRA